MPKKPLDPIKPVKRTRKKRTGIKINPILKHTLIIVSISLIVISGIFGYIKINNLKQASNLFKQGKYLVLFQNNAEMRPTGGFIGSFAVVEFADYKVKNIIFNTNIYKLDNAFTAKTNILPPKPLEKIAKGKWAMRDSNFAVDFPKAAQQVMWFYEQESGEKVDGVIAINASVIQEMLKISGPITLPQYNAVITANNYFEELATKIEKEYFYDKDNWSEDEPKSILKDMMPILFDKTVAASKIDLAKLIYNQILTKQILFYSNEQNIQSAIIKENLGGQIKETDGDYLYINNANITDMSVNKNMGAKTSLKINEAINYKIGKSDNNYVANLDISRTHTGSYQWPDGVNYNYARILVPLGSKLITAQKNGQDVMSEIETFEEAGKTVFAVWTETAPQDTSTVNLQYQLPQIQEPYSLLVQKQPGNLGDDLAVVLNNNNLFQGKLTKDLLLK